MTDTIALYNQACDDYGKVLQACFDDLDDNLEDAVSIVCAFGDSLALKWIFDHCADRACIVDTVVKCSICHDSVKYICFLMDDLKLLAFNTDLVESVCLYDCIDIIDHLIRSNDDVDVMMIIYMACDFSSLYILKYMLDKYQPKNIDDIFEYACQCDDIVAEYLVIEYAQISTDRFRVQVDHVDDDIIKNACKHGNISVLKQAFAMQNPDNINKIFQQACIFSNCVGKWLIMEYPYIDIHADGCKAFQNACEYADDSQYNDNFVLLINLSRDSDISYHNASPHFFTNEDGHIISTRKLDNIKAFSNFYESYNLYAYSWHYCENECVDLLVHSVYVRQIQKAINCSKKSVQ